MNYADLEKLAKLLAPMLVRELRAEIRMSSAETHLVGTTQIARFLGVSTETIRRRCKKGKLPLCGAEEYSIKGVPHVRPVCRISDLLALRENPSSKAIRLH